MLWNMLCNSKGLEAFELVKVSVVYSVWVLAAVRNQLKRNCLPVPGQRQTIYRYLLLFTDIIESREFLWRLFCDSR